MAGILFHVSDSAIGGIDEYTKLMLHMDGEDDGIVFTDDSTSEHSVTRFNAVTKTSIKKFGSAAGYFDADGNYLNVPNHEDWNFGSGDFTIDLWIRATSTGKTWQSTIISKILNATYYPSFAILQRNGTYNITFSAGSSGASWGDLIENAVIGTVVQNQWHHIAVVRQGSNVYTFLDGIIGSTTGIGSASLKNDSYPVLIGDGNYVSTYFPGYMDELRISKGIARWTSNFTPESGPYTI